MTQRGGGSDAPFQATAVHLVVLSQTAPRSHGYPARMERMAVKQYALGRLKVGQMNNTEMAYANRLKLLHRADEVAWYRFEGLKLRLADNTFYTPDFAVMLTNGQMECHEVKGFWQEDARVKIKVAAEQYPFLFKAVKAVKRRGEYEWTTEVFG